MAHELEARVPGFKAAFGGEELRRAQANMSGSRVPLGTVKALNAAELQGPPSLVSAPKGSDGHGSRGSSLDGGDASLAGKLETESGQDAVTRELLLVAQHYNHHMALHKQGAEALPIIRATGWGVVSESEFEVAYGSGLVLQELAARSAPGAAAHMARLQQACERYQAAVKLKPTSHSALYNWGVALSDLARVLRPTDAASARLCLEAAAERYAQALHICPDSPQALNNWGLVLQELSSMARVRSDRDQLIKHACAKFRQAILLRPEFDRGCYNLGTVCYAAACTLQGELAQVAGMPGATGQTGGAHMAAAVIGVAAAPDLDHQCAAREFEARHLFMCAAQYICLAYALQTGKEIYRKSLSVVRKCLPLPFLRAGWLQAPVPGTWGTADETWHRDWFVLDQVSLRAATTAEHAATSAQHPSHAASGVQVLALPLADVLTVSRVEDPTLPVGAALRVVMRGSQEMFYLVADNESEAEAWEVGLLLSAHVAQTRSADVLADALLP